VFGLGRFGVRGRFFFGLDSVGAGLIVVVGREHRGSLGGRGEHRDSPALRGGQGRVAPARFFMIVVAGSIGVAFGQCDRLSVCSGL
jgi:hypothetical protein